MITRVLLVTSVIAMGGLSLIGAGSYALFTQNTVSSQHITAGTMNVVISMGEAAGARTLTLAPVGPTSSTFTTGDQKVTITNKGTITVHEIFAKPGVVASGAANAALAAQVYLCEVSSGTVIYNGPLRSARAQKIQGSLAPKATDDYTVNYYAGTVKTACGAVKKVGAHAVAGVSHAPSLTKAAQGGVITATMTVSYTG